MDWKNLKEKAKIISGEALKYSKEAVKYSKIAIEKWKEYSEIAIDKTWQALASTSLSIKSINDFEKVKNNAILAILFIDKNQEESKKMLLTMPIILKDVWINWSTFRTCEVSENKEVAEKLNIIKTPFLLAFDKWEEKIRTDDIDDAKKFLKTYTF